MPRKAFILICAAPLLLLSSCAVPGAPMPPSLQLPRPVEDLNYARKGQRVVLSWAPPSQTTEHLGLRHIGATYICRTVGQYPVNACDIVKRLSPSDVALVTDKKREQAVFEDVLPADAISPSAFATYSVEVFNDRGRSAGLSNQVRVPLSPTLPIPQDLRVTVTAQGPVVQWTATAAPVAPNLNFEYRVERRLQGVPSFSNVEDVRADQAGPKSIVDRNFDWDKKYDYKIVPITQVAAAGSKDIEGDDSSIVSVDVKDVFPPATPASVQAVFSSVGQKPFIDLSWSPNTEPDLAGYDIYRHEANTQPVKLNPQPVKLNPQPVKAPSFRDEQVQPGKKYFYAVVAVDLRGNQSPHSDEATETVPADLH